MKSGVVIKVGLPDERLARSLVEALSPEALNPPTAKSRALVELRGAILLLYLEAETIPALRAALNSYLGLLTASLSVLIRVLKERGKGG